MWSRSAERIIVWELCQDNDIFIYRLDILKMHISKYIYFCIFWEGAEKGTYIVQNKDREIILSMMKVIQNLTHNWKLYKIIFFNYFSPNKAIKATRKQEVTETEINMEDSKIKDLKATEDGSWHFI